MLSVGVTYSTRDVMCDLINYGTRICDVGKTSKYNNILGDLKKRVLQQFSQ